MCVSLNAKWHLKTLNPSVHSDPCQKCFCCWGRQMTSCLNQFLLPCYLFVIIFVVCKKCYDQHLCVCWRSGSPSKWNFHHSLPTLLSFQTYMRRFTIWCLKPCGKRELSCFFLVKCPWHSVNWTISISTRNMCTLHHMRFTNTPLPICLHLK